MDLVRVSFSIERTLQGRLERLAAESHYSNRSEFIRDMIRDRIVEREWESDREALGTLTILYDHRQRGLSDRITDLQHHQRSSILATTHVHLDEHLCAEMIMAQGKASRIREFADSIRQQKGVLHAAVAMSSTGKKLR